MRKKYLDTRRRNELQPAHPAAVELTPTRQSGAFAFHYSYTEVSLQGGRTQLKSMQTRLEDGKLSSESFEGQLEPGVYQQIVGQWQQQALAQTEMVLRGLSSWLLGFSRR